MSDPKTPAEAFAAETETFRNPAAAADELAKEAAKDADSAGSDDEKSGADAGAAGDNGADASGADAAGKDGAESSAAANPGKDAGGDKTAKGSEKAPENIPDWMKRRIERANAKETAAETRARQAEEKAAELAEENARLKATPPAEIKKPDPDDFDTVDEYEDAKAAYDEARKPKPKAEAKPDPKKPEPAIPGLPPGVTAQEIVSALGVVDAALDAGMVAKLRALPVMPAAVLLELADEPDAEEQKAMARFMIGSPKVLAEVAKLPPRQQASAFVRMFTAAEKPAPKKKTDMADPITRESGAGAGSTVNLSKASFREFEKIMDAEDKKAGRRPY